MEAVIVLLILFFGYILWKRKKDKERFEEEKLIKLEINDEFKKTLALGIYQRFCKECDENSKYSQIYIKEDPYKFEEFVADIMRGSYGDDVFVTNSSGDFGVDVEHNDGDEKILGQVKCYKGDVGYEPIALIHSNMQKQNAHKGYVVTTGGFTENAFKYADGLNIDLIDGKKLVEMWIEAKKPIVEIVETQS